MNVVDSSAWLEYFADGANARHFAQAIENTESLLVPSLALPEVFRKVLEQRGEGDALQCVAVMEQGQVVDMNRALALEAARLSLELSLPLADSIMLATAWVHGAAFWTQDANFDRVDGVRYYPKR